MRSPDNARARSKSIAKGEVSGVSRTVQGWLTEAWDGRATYVMVRLDRGKGSISVRSKISLGGYIYSPVPVDTPVSVRLQRGGAEVLSIDSTASSSVVVSPLSGCELSRSAAQTIPDTTTTFIQFTSLIRNDLGTNIVLGIVALPSGGTVTKTNGSVTITGSGTKFFDDLDVGDIIQIPGTAIEYFVVVDIASQTSLTVGVPAANTASGQTMSTSATGIAIPVAGWYSYGARIQWAGNATGSRTTSILRNGDPIANARQNPTTTSVQYQNPHYSKYFDQWDLIQVTVAQTSGGNLTVDQTTSSPSLVVMTAIA